MSPIEIAILVGAFLSPLLITMGLTVVAWQGAGQRLSGREARIQQHLQELFISGVTPRQVTGLTLLGSLVTAIVAYMLTGSLVIAVAAVIGVQFLPEPVFMFLRRKRRQKFEEALPASLDQMANSAKAGLSLAQIFEDAAVNAPQPAAQECSLIVQDFHLGASLEEAVENARIRIDSKLFSLFATAIIVNREKGGDLPEALAIMSVSFKEIARLEQKLITASAEGRKAVRVISALPVFIFVMISLSQPEIVDTLTQTVPGLIILIVALIIYGIALWWLIRVLRIDV